MKEEQKKVFFAEIKQQPKNKMTIAEFCRMVSGTKNNENIVEINNNNEKEKER